VITAATTKREFLWPAMDARAHNLEQERVLFDPSPECDSLTERLNALHLHGACPAAIAECLHDVNRLLASNQLEGDSERRIAGAADQLASDLRWLELNQTGLVLALGTKSIAHQLRRPLSVIAARAGCKAGEWVAAVRAVDDVVAQVPRLQLFAPEVRHDLGEAAFALLVEIAESRLGLVA
jgi:hypothetical protein